MRQYLLSILLLLPLFFSSQYSKKKIDSLNMVIYQLRKEGELDDALALCKTILKDADTSMDKKELINFTIQTGNLLSNLSRIKESFDYLELAMEGNRELKDNVLQAKIYGEYGRNYFSLGFSQKALEYFTKSIDLSKNIENQKLKKSLLQYLYSTRAVIYEEDNQLDKLYNDLHKGYSNNPDTFCAARLAKYFTVHRKDMDSAKFYLQKGEQMFSTGRYPVFQRSILLRSYGRYYFAQKNYEKAIKYYKGSLTISEQLQKPKDVVDTHKLLYEAYKALDDDGNANESLEKYSRIKDSLSFENKKIQETPVKHILKEKEEQVVEKERNYLYFVFIVLLVIFLAVFFILKRIFKYNRKEKQVIISQNEAKTQELKLKVNESFDAVVQLAKSNSPEFWGRFQEVYPEFRTKLLAINPDLKPSELILSAYIYLGFMTKDIADYTFKAVKTIKNNKYNLRKRLDIPTEKDFTIWMRNYLD